ncbi:hypothetical protein [Dyella choica]|uniref:Uncharacterized protein n=1 Tax=Dyella choica TaxID=1927959 RepID=A0A3S0PNE4_9GAMM|nr:hypothetical protein [Dyella choica]RUL77489.1 hypothetical protein EKH80_06250 [Dyella choica]
MSRSDPVRTRYFTPLTRAELASDVLFYTGAALSIVVLLVDKTLRPTLHGSLMTVFAVSVAALFIITMVIRLYFAPRAADHRARDFVSSVYNVKLTHALTDGYYNNTLRTSEARLAAQVLENTHFSKAIVLAMVKDERIKVGIYATAWLITLLNRQASLDFILVGSQVVLSEQILSKWLRMEWLRSRCEAIYNDVYALFQSRPSEDTFNARALEAFGKYESAKANAAVTLSERIFQKQNNDLSSEWSDIKLALRMEQNP